MKKSIALLLVLALCLGLCACGSEESVTLPTKPAQSALQNQPAADGASGETQETTEPAVETYPWEAEFREEDYTRFEGDPAPNGDRAVTWLDGELLEKRVREIYEWVDGTTRDSYYYPSGNTSHSYMRYTDGSSVEAHYLDNGHIDPGNQMIHMGTQIYYKRIEPDGSENEQFFDENGTLTCVISKTADGTCSESYYFENGNVSKSFYNDPATGEHYEQEYFENGNLKYSKNQSPEYVSEERYDEEGYRTYFHSKNADWETECIADETGKLIKVIENGTVYEDAATLAQNTVNYNFRG